MARASSRCIKHSVLSQVAAKYNGVAPFLEAKFTSARSLPYVFFVLRAPRQLCGFFWRQKDFQKEVLLQLLSRLKVGIQQIWYLVIFVDLKNKKRIFLRFPNQFFHKQLVFQSHFGFFTIPNKIITGNISASKSIQQIKHLCCSYRWFQPEHLETFHRFFGETSKVHLVSAVRFPHDHWPLQDVLVECLVDWLSHDPLRSTSLSPRLSSNRGWFGARGHDILLMAEILHHLGCMKPYK